MVRRFYTGGTDPHGNALPGTTYDSAGRLQTVTDALGQKTSYSYSLNTNSTTITNPDNGTSVKLPGLAASQTVYNAYSEPTHSDRASCSRS